MLDIWVALAIAQPSSEKGVHDSRGAQLDRKLPNGRPRVNLVRVVITHPLPCLPITRYTPFSQDFASETTWALRLWQSRPTVSELATNCLLRLFLAPARLNIT